MILTELQTYLAKHHQASLADLANHFRTDAESLRSMLRRLIRKGRVRALPVVEKCHGCTSCSAAALEVYEWIEPEPSAATLHTDLHTKRSDRPMMTGV